MTSLLFRHRGYSGADPKMAAKVAVYQGSSVPGNVAANVATVCDVVADAARFEAHLVVFPEIFLAGYDIGAVQVRATAVPVTDEAIGRVQLAAREARITVVLPFAERDSDDKVSRRM